MAKSKQGFWSKFFTAFKIASTVGPVVVQAVDPADAELAAKLGQIANATVDAAESGSK